MQERRDHCIDWREENPSAFTRVLKGLQNCDLILRLHPILREEWFVMDGNVGEEQVNLPAHRLRHHYQKSDYPVYTAHRS